MKNKNLCYYEHKGSVHEYSGGGGGKYRGDQTNVST